MPLRISDTALHSCQNMPTFCAWKIRDHIWRHPMKLHRRQFLHLTAAAAVLSAPSCSAWAQAYPAKPVYLIVTFPAGSAPDIIGRLAGQWLSERLGQQSKVIKSAGIKVQ